MNPEFFSNLPWLQILAGGIVYFFLGAIWYSLLFNKTWIAYQGINMNDPDIKKGTAVIMMTSFIWMIIASVALGIIVTRLQLDNALSGVKWGLLTGICFSAMSISVTYLYVKKPLGLHIIDGLYHVVGQVLVAVLLCVWK